MNTHEFHRCPLTSLTRLCVGAPFVIVERVHGEGETTFFSYSDRAIQYCSPLGISTAKSSNCRDGKIKGGGGGSGEELWVEVRRVIVKEHLQKIEKW